MDSEQHLENQQQIDELRRKNMELKKELEREQTLHKILYQQWKKLSEQTVIKEQEVYENIRPKNLFYKYAFYVLLIGLIPAFYFLYPKANNEKTPSSQPVSNSMRADDSSLTKAAVKITESLPKKDSESIVQKKQTSKKNLIQQPAQPAPAQPLIESDKKKLTVQDSTKPVRLIIRKPVIETPLTDDARDSISSLGFSAYFDHHRNPFRKSSERYKIWAEGWNEGKAEAKKVIEKDQSLNH